MHALIVSDGCRVVKMFSALFSWKYLQKLKNLHSSNFDLIFMNVSFVCGVCVFSWLIHNSPAFKKF